MAQPTMENMSAAIGIRRWLSIHLAVERRAAFGCEVEPEVFLAANQSIDSVCEALAVNVGREPSNLWPAP
jgi:hypothetical protein